MKKLLDGNVTVCYYWATVVSYILNTYFYMQ